MGTKFWHYIVLIVIIFAVIGIYNAQTLKNVPLIGRFASA